MRLPLLVSLLLCSAGTLAAPPRTAVVLLQGKGVTPKEVEAILDAAFAAVKEHPPLKLDPAKSLEADNEVTMSGCKFQRSCLLAAAKSVEVDGLLAIRAGKDKKRNLGLEFLFLPASPELEGKAQSGSLSLPSQQLASLNKEVRAAVGGVLPASGVASGSPASTPAEVAANPIPPSPPAESLRAMDSPAKPSLLPQAAPVPALIPPGLAAENVEGSQQRAVRLRTAAWVSGGLSVASWVAFTVLGLQAKAASDSLRSCPPVGPCTSGTTQVDAQQIRSRGMQAATWANLSLAGGVVFGAAGGGLWWWSRSAEEGAR